MLTIMRPMNNRYKKGISKIFNQRPARKLLVLLIAALLVSSSFINVTEAAAGDLDMTFGAGGKVITDFGGREFAEDMVIQPDGRIIGAGPIGDQFAVARYNPDGSLDQTFGTGGKVVTNVIEGNTSWARAVALQPDGRIVVAGSTFTGSGKNDDTDIAVVRYNTNGSLDQTFGMGGKATANAGETDYAQDVAIDGAGRIVVAGASTGTIFSDFALARFNSNGSLDMSFDGDGIVTTDFFGNGDTATGVAIHQDGVVAVGVASVFDKISYSFVLARYEFNGSLDTDFGMGGKLIVDFGDRSQAEAVTIAPGNLILAAGIASTPTGGADVALVRLQANGSFDNSFGAGGKSVTDLGSDDDVANAIALQQDGRILVAGSWEMPRSETEATLGGFFDEEPIDFLLARFNANGSLDTNFGAGGKIITDFSGGVDEANAVAVQSDGRIVTAGVTREQEEGPIGDSVTNGGGGEPNPNIALARYRSDFDLVVQDNSNGNLLLIDRATGRYSFTDCRKGFTLTGQGTITIKSCKLELRDSGPNPKKSDRNLYALVNLCTAVGTVNLQVFSTGKSYTINDSNITDNTSFCSNSATSAASTMETESHIRFDPYNVCIWDETTHRLFRFSTITGRYQFSDCRKGITLTGTGVVVDDGCKIELSDAGPDYKRPDRSVEVLYNACTNEGNAVVQVSPTDKIRHVNGTSISQSQCVCR